MDVSCPACATRYTADEHKLRGKTARMRCKTCDTVWLVSGPEESKRAAVVKRGIEREHRDLFASRPVDLGSVKQTLRAPPPAESHSGGVAARNEASVLFTVDALRGNARVNTPVPTESPLSRRLVVEDDEGIIDLNALASTPTRVGSRSVAPLFSEPPPGAFAADVDGTGSQAIAKGGFPLSKRAMAGLGAAAVALVLGCLGLVAAFKGEEPVARTAALMAVAPPVTAAPPAVVPPPAPAAEPAPTTPSNDDAKASTAPSSKKARGKRGSGAASTKVHSSGVVATPKAPKAVDKCGCKGDFNCILRCTATGR